MRKIAVLVGMLCVGGVCFAAIDAGQVQSLVARGDIAGLKAMGPEILPELVRTYEASADPNEKARLALMFYQLGWKSPEAKAALMKDVHTEHSSLRLQVQWALGRVSNDADVVDVLLQNMRTDPNPLFRDKAACALASDQIHLTEEQKVRLFEGLIRSLRSANPQVRSIALQALRIHTGQTKNFRPNGSPEEREASIQVWFQWLEEYKANL